MGRYENQQGQRRFGKHCQTGRRKGVYGTLPPDNAACGRPSARGTLTEIDHILHPEHLTELKRVTVIRSMFFGRSGLELEMNDVRKMNQ